MWNRRLPWLTLLLALSAVRLPAQELVCTPIADAQNGSAFPSRPTDCSTYTGPFTQPAIFFAAHPDDETLGMAGSISQAVAAGRTVVVELMTRGTASGALSTLCGEQTSGTINHQHRLRLDALRGHHASGAVAVDPPRLLGHQRVRQRARPRVHGLDAPARRAGGGHP